MTTITLSVCVLCVGISVLSALTMGQSGPTAAQQKAFNSYPLENVHHISPKSDAAEVKPPSPDPYEVLSLLRDTQHNGPSTNNPTSFISSIAQTLDDFLALDDKSPHLIARKGEYQDKKPKEKPEGEEEAEEEESKEEEDEDEGEEENEEKSSEDDGEDESNGKNSQGGDGGGSTGSKNESEKVEGSGADGGGTDGGAAATKDGDKDTKNSGLDFVNLIGTDFQPGRLVNIFFGIILLMFMMIAQGYMMWVFGIAFLPGTRSLNQWELNMERLDNAMQIVIDGFEYWEAVIQKEKSHGRRR